MKKSCIAATAIFLIAQVCPAPICGIFSGFDSLIAESDSIAVVWIVHQKTGLSGTMGGYEEYEVSFWHMLKGEKPNESRTMISLRELPYGRGIRTGFAPSHSYLLFLKESEKDEIRYRNVNSSGSHWQVAQQPDFKALNKLTAKKAIRHLLEESLESKRSELAALQKDVEKALKD